MKLQYGKRAILSLILRPLRTPEAIVVQDSATEFPNVTSVTFLTHLRKGERFMLQKFVGLKSI
jgi:hypothetical protein